MTKGGKNKTKDFAEFRKFLIDNNYFVEYLKQKLIDHIEVLKNKNITAMNLSTVLVSSSLSITLDVLESYHEWLNS